MASQQQMKLSAIATLVSASTRAAWRASKPSRTIKSRAISIHNPAGVTVPGPPAHNRTATSCAGVRRATASWTATNSAIQAGDRNSGEEFAPYAVNPEYAPASDFAVPTLLKARSHPAAEEVDLYVIHGHYWNEERERWVAWFELNLDVALSRGRVRLTDPDPDAPLDINHAYLSDPKELEACCDGMELIEQLVTTGLLANALAPIPGQVPEWTSRDALRAWVYENVATSFHPSSTCRMGPDADRAAVVDHEFPRKVDEQRQLFSGGLDLPLFMLFQALTLWCLHLIRLS